MNVHAILVQITNRLDHFHHICASQHRWRPSMHLINHRMYYIHSWLYCFKLSSSSFCHEPYGLTPSLRTFFCCFFSSFHIFFFYISRCIAPSHSLYIQYDIIFIDSIFYLFLVLYPSSLVCTYDSLQLLLYDDTHTLILMLRAFNIIRGKGVQYRFEWYVLCAHCMNGDSTELLMWYNKLILWYMEKDGMFII